ncbi:TolC family outer membrane protein [Stutzerimonas kirkiae]|uniref:Channel protein TolC n=1 Tax=Stutzerimonas kirkiae TaxID=2211392 RepID=A0A4Q9RAR8_9GAMM|nr:TolC family outer membrane protein [Stutzerimonas kirkiae]TBU97884.1 channel protein TolC [Stutzerimonas kirkiae]TBV04600.1 channel protein TolC [Stutzerimonas kirkiae]TBV11635.1 channel protein TolC [Stutzerimonas kirkiae]TBV16062.1 channel protein TolC [Stutzerimonas kirkiae]
MLRRLPLAIAITLSLASNAWADNVLTPASKSDLLSVYREALNNNADLAAARAQFQASQETVPQARAGLLPNLSASAELGDSRTRIETQQGSQSFSRSGSAYQANLSQPLFRADRWYQLQAAKASSEQAALEYSVAEQNLVLQSAQAYFAVLRAQDNLAAVKAEEAAFKRQLDQANERFEVGLSDRTDVLEAQAGYDTARANRMIAQRQVDDAFQALATLTNRQYLALEGIRHSLPVLPPLPNDAQAWVETAARQNLALQASDQAVIAAEQTLRQRRSGHAPTLDAVASYRKGDNDTLGFSNSAAVATRYRGDAEQGSIGLQLNIPLYSGGLTNSQTRQAGHQLDQSEQLRESLRRQIVESTRNLHRAVNTDIEQVQARRQSIISNQSALEATEIGYQVGSRNIVDVLDTQRRLFAAVRDYNNARYDYILDNLLLKQSAGTLNPGDLQELANYLKPDYNPDTDFLPPDLSDSIGRPPRLD